MLEKMHVTVEGVERSEMGKLVEGVWRFVVTSILCSFSLGYLFLLHPQPQWLSRQSIAATFELQGQEFYQTRIRTIQSEQYKSVVDVIRGCKCDGCSLGNLSCGCFHANPIMTVSQLVLSTTAHPPLDSRNL